GNTLLSAETCQQLEGITAYTFIQDHSPQFFELLERLSPNYQDLLLSYFVLNRSQTSLSYIFDDAQTRISTTIRLAMKRLCFYVMFNTVTAETLSPVLTRAGLEWPAYRSSKRSRKPIAVPLSKVIETFDKCRSFTKTADKLKVHRPDIRRSMSKAA